MNFWFEFLDNHMNEKVITGGLLQIKMVQFWQIKHTNLVFMESQHHKCKCSWNQTTKN
jgi:hypothetical protein